MEQIEYVKYEYLYLIVWNIWNMSICAIIKYKYMANIIHHNFPNEKRTY